MKELFSLGKLHVSDFVKQDNPVEMKLFLTEDGAVRLGESAPMNTMYGRYWYRSSVTETMRSELKDIVDSIFKVVKLKENDLFVDVACNDGTLLSYVPKHLIRVGIDPADDSFKEESQKYAHLIIQDFFTAAGFKKSKFGKLKAKVITSIAMFYDLEFPEVFIKDINEVLDDNGLLVMQLSYTPLQLEQVAFDNIVHEHIYYYSFFNLKLLLERGGFKIMDCQLNDTNGGSFRVYIMKQSCPDKYFSSQPYRDVCNFRMRSLLQYEKSLNLTAVKTWSRFFNKVNELKEKTVSFIKAEKKKGKTVYAYGACHDMQTRLVTENGIKNISDVSIDDKVYTLNIKTKEIEICPITEIIKFPYVGEMIHFKGKRVDQLVTPNHKVLFETKIKPGLRFEAAEKISKRSLFYLPQSTWVGKDEEEIDIRKFVDQKDYSYHRRIIQNVFNINDFLYLIGIFIGDGYVCDKKNQGFSINLCIPEKDKAREKVKAALKRMNLSFREYDVELQVASKALCVICSDCGSGALSKRIPKWALEYSPKQLSFLLEGLVDSDGWYERGETNTRRKFCSSSFKLVKDVCELCLKLGYFPSICKRKKRDTPPKIRGREIPQNDAYIINICTNHPASYSHSKVEYAGDVWCLSVKNKNFLIERNGKLCFSGNSTKGNTLLQYFGLDHTIITAIAERSIEKWGLRTVATNIPIISEEEMRKAKPDFLLILPWHFINEFLEREAALLLSGTKFIVPCPKFEIISK